MGNTIPDDRLLARLKEQMLTLLVRDFGYTHQPQNGHAPIRHQLAWMWATEGLDPARLQVEIADHVEQERLDCEWLMGRSALNEFEPALNFETILRDGCMELRVMVSVRKPMTNQDLTRIFAVASGQASEELEKKGAFRDIAWLQTGKCVHPNTHRVGAGWRCNDCGTWTKFVHADEEPQS